jgi:hypothetical protein
MQGTYKKECGAFMQQLLLQNHYNTFPLWLNTTVAVNNVINIARLANETQI